jgi:chromate transporter
MVHRDLKDKEFGRLETSGSNPEIKPSSLWEIVRYFLKLGTIGFGGPIALAGYMERDLVEDRHWFTDTDYRQGLALAQLHPGPLAAQLAIFLGYIHSGILGATVVAFAFILPSFLMVIAISEIYVRYGGSHLMQALFYGIGAAVIGIIIRSAFKLTKRQVGKKRLLWGIYAVMALVTAITRSEIIWLFILSGFITLIVYAPPRWMQKSGQELAVDPIVLWNILGYFTKAGAFVFGSGLAVVPFLYGGVVKDFHWLTEKQFIDAVAVAMITPGPVVITVAFIGYLVARLPGACMAAIGIFLPVYLFVIIPTRWYRKYGTSPKIVAFVEGVTAAAIGAITGAVYVIGGGAIKDIPTALIAVGALLALIYTKVPEPILVVIAGCLGFFLYKS